jgi:hypothetical protein
LGRDLGLCDFKVTTNPGGIAISGEITLIGVWEDGRGLYFQINQPSKPSGGFLYRPVKHMKDYVGGNNLRLPCSLFETGDYEGLISALKELKEVWGRTEAEHHAA